MKTSKFILPVLLIVGIIFTGCAKKLEVSKEPIVVPQTQIVESDKEKLEAQSKLDQSKNEAEAKAKQETEANAKAKLEAQAKATAEALAKKKAEEKAKQVALTPVKNLISPVPVNNNNTSPKPAPKPTPEPTKQVPTQTPSKKRPTLPSKYPLEYQADVENEVVILCNIERAKVGAKPYVMNETLRNVARYKSNDMLQYNYFAHTSASNGLEPHELVDSFGYKWTTTGENIWAYKMELDPSSSSYDYFFEIYKKNTTASQIVTDWMNSPGHRANILKGTYGRIGVGVVYSTVGKTYATQEFSN